MNARRTPLRQHARGAALLLSLLGGACASTHTSTELTPASGEYRYARLLVIFPTWDRAFQASAESTFASTRGTTGSQIVASKAVALPAVPVDDSTMRTLLDAQAIDGVLIVRLAALGPVTTREVRDTPLCTSGTPMRCLGLVPRSATHWETTVGKLTFRAALYDAHTMHAVWVGRTDVYRNGAPTEPYLPALAKEVMVTLGREHLLLPPPTTD